MITLCFSNWKLPKLCHSRAPVPQKTDSYELDYSISKMEKQEEIKRFFHELKLNNGLDSESEFVFVKECYLFYNWQSKSLINTSNCEIATTMWSII